MVSRTDFASLSYPLKRGNSVVTDAGSTLDLLRDRLRLDHETVEPYYVQLQRQLQHLIETGVLAEGVNLPSERDLAEMLHVSRTTIKRSYDALRQQQALVSSQGRGGTIVRSLPPRISPLMSRLKGFTEEMLEMGLIPSSQVLECKTVSDRMVASVFGRASNAKFLRVVRLRFGNDIPMSREVAWYDLMLAPEMAKWDGQGSAYEILRERCSLTLTWAQQSIEAVFSTADETKVFGFVDPSPCLLLKRNTYTADDRLVEYVEGTFRGDAYVYRLRLQG